MLLRRGRVPGMASGPVWRLIGTTAVGLLLLTFTPTKWAVQFGAFAGLAGALGAVTAFTFARVGLHSRRNLALYVTALLFVLAWATSGINGWFYVGNYGVPWFDKQPVIVEPPGDVDVPGAGHPRPVCWPAGCTSGWTTPGTPKSRTPGATGCWRPPRCWWSRRSWSSAKSHRGSTQPNE